MDTVNKQMAPTVGEQIPTVHDTAETGGTRYSISQVRPLRGYWLDGKVGGLNFSAKVYKGGSRFGINGGNVSKLSVWPEHGPAIINYDRGWDIMPKNAEEEEIVEAILGYCRHVYDGTEDSSQPPIS